MATPPPLTVAPSFVSLGCNRVVGALDWGCNGLVAYGGHSIVCICDPENAKVVGTLTGHSGLVTCVQWVPPAVAGHQHGAAILVSGAADGMVRVWAWHNADEAQPWTCLHTLEGHQSPVTFIAMHALSDSAFMLATTSGDPHISVWECQHNSTAQTAPAGGAAAAAAEASSSNGHSSADATSSSPSPSSSGAQESLAASFGPAAWRLLQRLPLGTRLQHCLALAALPSDPGWLLMAAGGTDSLVRLYVRPPGGDFVRACELLGHENWVRAVAFTRVAGQAGEGESLLLASASQDRYIRLWSIQLEGQGGDSYSHGTDDSLAASITRFAPHPHFATPQHTYWTSLEALLIGHEDWIHSVAWRPVPDEGSSTADLPAAATAPSRPDGAVNAEPATQAAALPREQLRLLSASQDRTMILWHCDLASGLWLNEASVGDAGAACLGYYGGVWAPDGASVLAHGFTGALHLWRSKGGQWQPQHALGGHYGPVADLCWGVDGGCLISASCDQTARMFTSVRGHWCELARMQVHGHDFSCITSIPEPAAAAAVSSGAGSQSVSDSVEAGAADAGGGTGGCSTSSSSASSSSFMFASGSEEKVLRVFEAPTAFLDTLAHARGRTPHSSSHAAGGAAGSGSSSRAFGAAVAALGLSNKALYADAAEDGEGASVPEGPDFVAVAAPAALQGPPLEEHLASNTLWPEVRKLYGHGNDVFCAAAAPNGRVLASACRAQTAAAAAVWLWSVGEWRPLGQLAGHTLTVTQLEFSHGGGRLASASRDRTFAVWDVPGGAACSGGDGGGDARLLRRVKGAHARIVWGVSWTYDDRYLATCSRDHTVKLWAVSDEGPEEQPICTLPAFSSPVTTVAAAPDSGATGCSYVLAVGMEDGGLELWGVEVPSGSSRQLWVAPAATKHAAAVRRLRWAPSEVNAAGHSSLQLASCSDDHSVRLFTVYW